ncbi:MAG: hypothetical protein R2856_13725 [Caldilineaceae bacterium]
MILGNYISAEVEADRGADADGPNNLQANGGALIPNRDRADDGWLSRNTTFDNCRRTTLTVRVSKALSATLDTAYLNVFFDGNRDGDWADVGVCEADSGQQSLSNEWIVQNFPVDMTGIPAGGHRDITVNTILVHNLAPEHSHWLRLPSAKAWQWKIPPSTAPMAAALPPVSASARPKTTSTCPSRKDSRANC